MKKLVVIALISIMLISCSRSMNPSRAAQGPQKCGKSIR